MAATLVTKTADLSRTAIRTGIVVFGLRIRFRNLVRRITSALIADLARTAIGSECDGRSDQHEQRDPRAQFHTLDLSDFGTESFRVSTAPRCRCSCYCPIPAELRRWRPKY
jgi:hypothetical protein